MAVLNKGWLVVILIVVVIFSVLLLRHKSPCDPVSCVARSESYCKDGKIVNVTFACISGECQILSNNSFDCKTLDSRSCFNQSVISIKSYSCMNDSCVGSVDIIECVNGTCVDGECVVTCGNGIIDEGEDCLNCPKDVVCNDDEKCLNAVCVPKYLEEKVCKADPDCDDDNPCTVDFCDKQEGKCYNKFLRHKVPSFCCGFDNDCDDGDVCTRDSCSKNLCIHDPIEGCCNSNDDCDDGNVCSEDSCVEHSCKHAYRVMLDDVCCARDDDCDDGDFCTVDLCAGENLSRRCVHKRIPECCSFADDCDDGDVCTMDSCNNGHCLHKALVPDEPYNISGYCSGGENKTAREHCVLDLYSDFFHLDDVFAWCKVDDCLANGFCMPECSVVKPDGKIAFVCKRGEWKKR
ncbi:hypothetical protein DRJ25_00385 [Candidatus Woesearchaeota archaeon]|nr:MAG: hypothetical protein DRJ25_00385 [Candidatus Woesearchaeota archaeon]